jgi:ribosome-associated translation inhibitor RaiA
MAALMKFDTLSWAKKLEQAGVPPQQAEVQVELIFRAIDDNICTKQDLRELEGNISIKLKELELKIEGIRRESLGIKSDLELKIEGSRKDLGLKIEEIRSGLELKIEGTRGDLELKIEEVRKDLTVAIEKVNASISKQIAKWVLGVSAIQVTVLITLIRFMH